MKVEQVVKSDGSRGLVKMWEPAGYPFEDEAMMQIRNMASMPFIHKHVAVMPDAHAGKGSTVGTVIATKGAVIPAAVGVDIGCGMMAIRLNITASQLPDNLFAIRSAIEAAVPHGRSPMMDIAVGRDVGSWDHDEVPDSNRNRWNGIDDRYQAIIAKHPKIAGRRHPSTHLGTLGTGNHFIEICEDEDQQVWVMLHSGSRGIGNAIGTYFIEKAMEEMRRYHITPNLPKNSKGKPDEDLSYLVEHSEIYDDYMTAVMWGQDFAVENRKAMMQQVLGAFRSVFPDFMVTEHAVECHHNYVTKEQHFGANVLVTRKGAVQAREGTMGIIPGSMGVGSFIVRGKGNKDSFCSCSHGAGRTMSRAKARKMITLDQHREAMQGIESRIDMDILDESPAAYKPLGAVMEAQDDLVEIVHRLKPLINVKG
jgi:tRNA-splicing ligase RtcB